MKKQLFGAIAISVLAAGSIAHAQDDGAFGSVSGSIALTSDYIFRGYSQTAEDPAIQGGLTWSADAGFYAGFWGSNVEFAPGDGASLELDLFAGYSGAVDNLSYDVGVIYYAYPGDAAGTNYDYWEGAVKLGYDFGPASWTAGVYYSPDNFGGTNDAVYLTTGVAVPLAENFSIDANIGRNEVDPSFGPDYFDWNVGMTVSLPWADASVRYYDTDVSGCALCDSRVVFTISKGF
ncbi:MAG: TorF family putative porin [Rhodobacteraceae bacterium]|nr:TorF family putative porin [Paracoccaceae bacterium]